MARPTSDEELQLRRRARRRLVGAIVLVTAIVVALPMVLDTEPKPIGGEVSIKIPSPDSGGFTSRVVPVAPPGETRPDPAAKPSAEMKAAPEGKQSAATPALPPAQGAGTQVPEKVAKAAETEAPARNPAPKKPRSETPEAPLFVVQVVALADAGKAKQVQAQIAAAGIKAYTEVVKTAKGDVTRVRAGPFPTRAAAEKARDQLKAAGLSGNVVAK